MGEKMKESTEYEPKENYVKFKQNAKGIWICDGLVVFHNDFNVSIECTEKWIDYITEMLKEKNKNIIIQNEENLKSKS